MHDEFQYLTELPGTPKKQSWVQDRLEILSEWERVMLTAVTRHCGGGIQLSAVAGIRLCILCNERL